MFEYLPQMMKETSDARREELLREAEIERKYKHLIGPPKRAFFKHLRSVIMRMFS